MTTLLALAMSLIIIQDYTIIDIVSYNLDSDSLSTVINASVLFKPVSNPLFVQRLQKGNTVMRPITPLPVTEPWMLPREIYGALMGLLCSTGCSFAPNMNAYMYPNEFRLILSATNLDFLLWVQHYFTPWIYYTEGGHVPMPYTNDRKTSTGWRVATSSSLLLINILNEHWHQEGNHFLPDHFEEYFGWTTLSFWAMRNGRAMGYRLNITAPKLDQMEKERLVQVLSDKLNLTAKFMKDKRTLEIYDLPDWKSNLAEHFHESQLYRLSPRARNS